MAASYKTIKAVKQDFGSSNHHDFCPLVKQDSAGVG